MPLATIEFPEKDIQLFPIYQNKRALEEIKNSSPDQKIPQKVSAVYGPLYFPASPIHRPYLFGCFVLTLDGKLGFNSYPKSTAISKHNFLDPQGGLADLWIVNLLRTYADGILLGSKTLTVEANITGHIYDRDLQLARENVLFKKPSIPWNIIISRRGEGLPLHHQLFSQKEIPICIITSPRGYAYLSKEIRIPFLTLGPFSHEEDLLHMGSLESYIQRRQHNFILLVLGKEDKINPFLQFKILKKMGIQRISIESPSYFFYLLKEKLLDEAFINYSCLYAGGQLSFGSQYAFSPTNYPGAQLLSIHIHRDHFLYTRQKLYYQ